MSLRPELLERIRINKANTIRDAVQAKAFAESEAGPITEDIMSGLTAQLTAAERHELEHVPRDTVLKLLSNKQLDEHFIFMTTHGQGENYVQAMRQVLARTRKKAAKKKVRLQEFKMYVVSIKRNEDHDVVTVVRTRKMPEHLESVYDALLDAFEKK